MLFRKKPVVVEAIKVKDALVAAAGSWRSLPEWLQEAYERGAIFFESGKIWISGTVYGDFEDWIVKEVASGKIFVCKSEIFEAEYGPIKGKLGGP